MAVEHQLGLLRDLPDPHSVVPAPRGHTALPAQTVQARDGILVPKAMRHNHEDDEDGDEGGLVTGRPDGGGYSQGLHVGIFVHVPHLDGAVV